MEGLVELLTVTGLNREGVKCVKEVADSDAATVPYVVDSDAEDLEMAPCRHFFRDSVCEILLETLADASFEGDTENRVTDSVFTLRLLGVSVAEAAAENVSDSGSC